MSSPDLPSGYQIVPAAPAPQPYCELRRLAGLSRKTVAQATPALAGSWSACHVLQVSTDVPVAMGRVVGDGGWYFQIADVATHPEHQRRGLGAVVLDWLLSSIHDAVPDEPYVTLLADPPGRALYERFGFVETAPASVGMKLRHPRGRSRG